MKFFSLIYQGDLHTATEEKILPQEDYSILLSAHEVLERAQEDARQLRQETEEECVRLKATAQAEGFEQGLNNFNDKLLHFDKKLTQLHHETYLQILPIALKAAKKIVTEELKLHPERIVDIVLQALTPVTQAEKVTIYVNKGDKEVLESERNQLKEKLEQVKVLVIQERDDVDLGGCIIDIPKLGIINVTLENQWRALEAAFERYKK